MLVTASKRALGASYGCGGLGDDAHHGASVEH